uniref:RNA binding motif, single stranded interacting protein 2b n=1 Tax=Labrus bergylta TaxID=56723 RepID=A0A3Q3F4E6_9LABR
MKPKSSQQEQDPTNLYISNLPQSMDEQELENMLKPFSQAISTRILRDANGTSRGVGFARMESTEKCEAIIQHFNGKYIKTPPGVPVPLEPLLCKFADGGQKKRQSQGKYLQNGRPWARDGENVSSTYPNDLSKNRFCVFLCRFYSSPYSIAPNRMLGPSSLSPYMHSPVSTYQLCNLIVVTLQVHNPSWLHHQSYIMPPTGAVLTPGMDHTMSMQPTSMMGPLTQQLSHLSMGSSGTYMPANTSMQGTYIPQYTQVPATNISVEESAVQPPVAIETPTEHTTYSYQHNK